MMSESHTFELSPSRRLILAATTARILPSQDGPGAAEAGVVDYIEVAMQDPWNRHFHGLLERGLDFIRHLGEKLKNKDFSMCEPTEQDEVLLYLQEFPNNDCRRFFYKLIELTLEGCLCSPKHGGNRDHLGWRYVGFEPGAPTICEQDGGR